MAVNTTERNSTVIAGALSELQALRKNAMETHDLNISALSGMTGESVEYQRSLEKTIYSRYMDVIDRIEMKLVGLDSVKTAELRSGVVTKADGAANRLLEDDYELL
jgi:hypothetical protein